MDVSIAGSRTLATAENNGNESEEALKSNEEEYKCDDKNCEANVELFSTVEQLVEEHLFLRSTLLVKLKSSWSVDSFRPGGTFTHLLHKSGIPNMVIMRVHYAWKEWLARYQQGDIVSEGRLAYWSGYYSTRPFLKQLSRQLASKLRVTEILNTLAVSMARNVRFGLHLGIMESSYDQLVEARRELGLLQHYDAITGTSKAFIMSDYQQRLLSGLSTVKRIREMSSQYLMQKKREDVDITMVLQHIEWREEGGLVHSRVLDMMGIKNQSLVVFKSLVEHWEEVVTVMINEASVCVQDTTGFIIDSQILFISESKGKGNPIVIER